MQPICMHALMTAAIAFVVWGVLNWLCMKAVDSCTKLLQLVVAKSAALMQQRTT